jgi:hypothetical protein
MSGAVWIGLWILLGALCLELFAGKQISEGFQALTAPPPEPSKPSILTNLIKRRGDVGIGMELAGNIQDRRYFADYVDVQRYGVNNDLCRLVRPSDDPTAAFFACALAGTESTSPYGFRTKSVKEGLKLSRDDYMRDILNDGRAAYCRILRQDDGSYQPMCLRALDTSFSELNELDPEPPEEIKQMLDFYNGCQLWFRFRDDMLDYIENRAVVQLAGGIKIDEAPKPPMTEGVHFNGKDQFIRFGDTKDLSLGNMIQMRTIRAFSMWVKFDEFTNNAHIFDFGEGAGNNNTWLGILGKGEGGDEGALRPKGGCDSTTVPDIPSGAQFCPEMRPQTLMETSAANVDEYTCPGFEVEARRLPPSAVPKPLAAGAGGPNATRATLQYEVWDKKLRKVQIKVNRAIPLGKWTHIVVTAKNADVMRPDIQIWVNGQLLFTQESGYLPQAKTTSKNYLGKSNWFNESSEFELRDELFKGSLFDFRMYSSFLSESKIQRIMKWGASMLAIDPATLNAGGQ